MKHKIRSLVDVTDEDPKEAGGPAYRHSFLFNLIPVVMMISSKKAAHGYEALDDSGSARFVTPTEAAGDEEFQAARHVAVEGFDGIAQSRLTTAGDHGELLHGDEFICSQGKSVRVGGRLRFLVSKWNVFR